MGRKMIVPTKMETKFTSGPSFIFHLMSMNLSLMAKWMVNSAIAGIANCR